MQLISFIASVMTVCSFIRKSCVCTCWKKWRPFYIFLVIHQQSLTSIFVENGCILGKSTKGAWISFNLDGIFGHQPTYKNLIGNTAYQTVHRSFEIILEWVLSIGLEFKSNVLCKPIASKKHSIWYELNLKKYLIAEGSSGSNGWAWEKREQTYSR